MCKQEEKYTDEQKAYLKEHCKVSRKLLTEMFNKEFNEHRTVIGIKTYCKRHGFHKVEGNGQFVNGHKAWNKDMPTEELKTHYTKESYANATADTLPRHTKYKIGDRFFNKENGRKVPYILTSTESYVDLKKRGIKESVYVWEKHNGPLDPENFVWNLDGNLMNNDISNLVLIQKKDIPKLAPFYGNKDLVLLGIKLCELEQLIKEETK